jgi:putative hydrolase of the HAD superfamily
MSIKAITFDVGDTLLRLRLPRAEAFARVARQYGYDITPVQLEPLIPRMNAYLISLWGDDFSFEANETRAQAINIAKYEYLCELAGIDTNRTKIARAVQELYHQSDAWELFPGTIETLTALKDRGLKLAVISNWTLTLESILEGVGIREYFSQVIVSTVVHLYKPQPEIFHLVAKTWGLQPNECLHVGDNLRTDIDGALAAGFNAVLFAPDGAGAGTSTGTDAEKDRSAPTIAALPELLSLLDS